MVKCDPTNENENCEKEKTYSSITGEYQEESQPYKLIKVDSIACSKDKVKRMTDYLEAKGDKNLIDINAVHNAQCFDNENIEIQGSFDARDYKAFKIAFAPCYHNLEIEGVCDDDLYTAKSTD